MGRPGKGRDSMMQKQQNIQPDGRSQTDCGFSHDRNHYHAVSLSRGKDSTAMLLLMIERGIPIDAVLSADTGMEFPEMYVHLQKLDDYLYRERGLHIITLRHPKGFEWMMFEEPKQKPSCLANRQRLGIPPYRNGWPGIKVRWCTGQLENPSAVQRGQPAEKRTQRPAIHRDCGR